MDQSSQTDKNSINFGGIVLKHIRCKPAPLILTLLLFLTVLVDPGNVRAKPVSDNLIFILDASVSMGAQLEDKTKLDSVKEVLTKLAEKFPDQQNIALTAFGSNQKGDCKDVEELIPLSLVSRQNLIRKIQSVKPRGMTPLALSIRQTVEKLKGIKSQTTVILIADGQDTCMGDPCTLVRKLKAGGIKFVINVIGLGIPKAEKKQLSCIAEAGKGRYYSVENAKELTQAIKKSIKKSDSATSHLKAATKKDNKEVQAVLEGQNKKIKQPYQETGETAILKVRSGRVRQKPSLKSEIRFKLKKGDIVSVIETKDEWYHVILDDGRDGWSHESLFQKNEPAPSLDDEPEKDGKKVTLELDQGLIRKGPSIHFEVKFTLKKGDTVSIIGTKNNWYFIRLDDGRTGWAYKRLFPQLYNKPDSAREKKKEKEKKEDAKVTITSDNGKEQVTP